MIKAGALNYSIFVMVIAGVLCFLMINMAFMNRSFFVHLDLEDCVRENANSGVALAMSFDYETNQSNWFDLFNDGSDSVYVISKPWGAFKSVSSKATSKGKSYHKSCITGYSCAGQENLALWLNDNNRKLQLAGTALLKGNVFLPIKGVDRAYVEGKNYHRDQLVYGSIFLSSKKKLVPEKALKVQWERYLNGYFDPLDSVVEFELLPINLTHSFSKRTLVALSNSLIKIDHYQLNGNIIIISKNKISISASSSLDHVMLIAPNVEFEENTIARVHTVTSDTVVLRSNTKLLYPSSFISIGSTNKEAYCKISSGAQLFGAILSFSESLRKTNRLSVEIEDGSRIKGIVYAENNLEIGGLVEGSVICNRFLLSTPSGIYENHIFNGQIDRSKIERDFATIPFENEQSTSKIISWLNY